MTTRQPEPQHDITVIPRAVISAAVGMVHRVEKAVGRPTQLRSARDNAWEAICADRARAHEQAAVRQLVAGLAEGRRPQSV